MEQIHKDSYKIGGEKRGEPKNMMEHLKVCKVSPYLQTSTGKQKVNSKSNLNSPDSCSKEVKLSPYFQKAGGVISDLLTLSFDVKTAAEVAKEEIEKIMQILKGRAIMIKSLCP
ncbi:hypothetical protein WN944_019529 [Citrus x changshan-huyou]|uniref:Uncharacterized protein n=1 Tax=Citrus x changshan-huyou TaxID=2935761 RepID=A0AAP0LVN5_9ROSI